MTIKPGIYPDMPNEQYHSCAGISKSGLDLIAKCPALYEDRYIKGNKIEPTKAMVEGSAIHAAVFEPEKFDSEYAVSPAVDKRTKAGKEAYAKFVEDNSGKTILTADDYERIMKVSGSVRRHPMAASVLSDGQTETSIFHQDYATGELVKVRPDWIHEDLIVDLKTTQDASSSGFSRSCFNFRYYVQAGMYLDIANAQMDNRFNNFLFICVEKSEPYQVAIYVADNEMVAMGRAEYQQNLDKYSRLRRENRWPGYNDGKIVPISLPPWAANVIGYQPEIYD